MIHNSPERERVGYRVSTRSRSQLRRWRLDVAALQRSANVAGRDHAFAMFKRGYFRRVVAVPPKGAAPPPAHCSQKSPGPPPSVREGPSQGMRRYSEAMIRNTYHFSLGYLKESFISHALIALLNSPLDLVDCRME